MSATLEISYLSAAEAQQIDEELMGPNINYQLEQLVELAGLSVAQAVAASFAETTQKPAGSKGRILVLVGPGNNGADGLVAARHLRLFGFDADIVCPKKPKKELYRNLLQQAKEHQAEVFQEMPSDLSPYALLLDAVFGFSFSGPARSPYAELLAAAKASNVAVFAVDVPSGWHVDAGDTSGDGLQPAGLISLTAPKKCAANFKGVHFIGGRFLPESLKRKFSLMLPEYPGTAGIVRIA